MTTEQLEHLARRRSEVLKNMEYCERSLRNAQNKVHEYEEEIATANDVLTSIDYSLNEHLSENQAEIKAYSCFNEDDEETIMLKIEIPGFREPIYKVLDRMDIALYIKKENIIDEMALRGKLIELGMSFLLEGQLTKKFENVGRSFLSVARHFANSRIVQNRLMSR